MNRNKVNNCLADFAEDRLYRGTVGLLIEGAGDFEYCNRVPEYYDETDTAGLLHVMNGGADVAVVPVENRQKIMFFDSMESFLLQYCASDWCMNVWKECMMVERQVKYLFVQRGGTDFVKAVVIRCLNRQWQIVRWVAHELHGQNKNREMLMRIKSIFMFNLLRMYGIYSQLMTEVEKEKFMFIKNMVLNCNGVLDGCDGVYGILAQLFRIKTEIYRLNVRVENHNENRDRALETIEELRGTLKNTGTMMEKMQNPDLNWIYDYARQLREKAERLNESMAEKIEVIMDADQNWVEMNKRRFMDFCRNMMGQATKYKSKRNRHSEPGPLLTEQDVEVLAGGVEQIVLNNALNYVPTGKLELNGTNRMGVFYMLLTCLAMYKNFWEKKEAELNEHGLTKPIFPNVRKRLIEFGIRIFGKEEGQYEFYSKKAGVYDSKFENMEIKKWEHYMEKMKVLLGE